MITITVDLKSHHYQQTFNKDHLVIGSISDGDVDVLLALQDIQEEHVRVDYKNNSYYIHNVANDPFVTLNGMPFGKRRLNVGDRLAIHSVEIFFDFLGQADEPSTEKEVTEALPIPSAQPLREIVENKILEKSHHIQEVRPEPEKETITEDEYKQSFPEPPPLFDLEKEEEEENDSELDISEIESLLEEAERLESIFNDSDVKQSNEVKKLFEDAEEVNSKPLHSILEDEADLSDQENDDLLQNNHPLHSKKNDLESSLNLTEEVKPKKKIGLWLLFIALLFAFLLILAAVELTSNPTRSQIINAAQTGADTSMSLLNAKLQHIKPHNQNWSDPNFLKDSLNTILSSRYQPFLDFDAKGALTESRYILRLYNTRDLSRFLVVLHPSSSIINWLSPNKAVLIDSQNMQIRLFSDFKPLQKILTSSLTLDSVDQELLTNLISQGDILPLEELIKDGDYPEFKVPAKLAALNPGAEDIIYNAPRYFKLTAPIADEAAEIGLELENSPVLNGLTEQLTTLAQLPKLVIYSTEGLHGATMAQKGISAAGFNNRFPISYVIFDSKSKSGLETVIIPELPEPEIKEIADAQEDNRDPVFIDSIEALYEHPVNYQDLSPAESERLERLKPVKNAMIDLISAHSIAPVENFYDRIQALLESYEALDNELVAEANEVSLKESPSKDDQFEEDEQPAL